MLTGSDVLCDVLAAAGTAFCVAPVMSILDQAIVQNASGTKTIRVSIMDSLTQMFKHPGTFVRTPAFLLLWGVYGGTYLAVNTATTVCDKRQATDEQRHLVKFVGVSSVNIALNVNKDRVFATMFGSSARHPVPWKTIGAFGARDSMTVFASFNVAPMLAESLAGAEVAGARTIAQILCPVAMQWFSSPLSLIGLNWYNHPNVTTSERFSFIQRKYLTQALAQSSRIIPAFGIAPLINVPLRQFTRSVLVDHESQWEVVTRPTVSVYRQVLLKQQQVPMATSPPK